jgi:hypothetical protein
MFKNQFVENSPDRDDILEVPTLREGEIKERAGRIANEELRISAP